MVFYYCLRSPVRCMLGEIMRVWKIAGVVIAVCVLLYGALSAGLYWAMSQPPEYFGAVMRHVPGIAMMLLPFEPLWMSARAGTLRAGDTAPEFDLPTVDHLHRVRISEQYRSQPLVLIFGSYT